MHPTEIRLNRERTRLTVIWDSGACSDFPATSLRERARDANSVRIAIDGPAVPAAANLIITKVEPIGNYALRLSFSDGHDRGIFPWSYLSEIAAAAFPAAAATR